MISKNKKYIFFVIISRILYTTIFYHNNRKCDIITKKKYSVKCDESTLGKFEQKVLNYLNWTELTHLENGNFLDKDNNPAFKWYYPIRIKWDKIKDNKYIYRFYFLPMVMIPLGKLRYDLLDLNINTLKINATGHVGCQEFNFYMTPICNI